MNNEKDQINQLLATSIVRIRFTKVDGTIRVMNCTKSSQYIPQESMPGSGLEYQSDSVCRVFDVDVQGWRSFRWDSLLDFSVA